MRYPTRCCRPWRPCLISLPLVLGCAAATSSRPLAPPAETARSASSNAAAGTRDVRHAANAQPALQPNQAEAAQSGNGLVTATDQGPHTENDATPASYTPSPIVVAAAGAPLSLGAFGHTRPQCPNDATAAEVAFCRAATQALRATFEEDCDDNAQLLALINQLGVRQDLHRLALRWTSALHHAHARAALLEELSGPLRQLRRAVANAYLEPRTNLYRGVRTGDCKHAFASLAARSESWQDLVVTVEPLGTWPLSTLRRFCLYDRQLPTQ